MSCGSGAPLALALGDERLHVDQVDDAAHLVLRTDRDLGGGDVVAEGALQRLEGAKEVGALAVEHVDEDESRQALVVGPLPEPVGVHLDPHHSVDDDNRGIGDAQGGDCVGDEARIAGGVDQVDLPPVVVEGGDGGSDRHLPLLLVGLEVRGRAPVLHTTQPVDHPGLEEQGLVKRGLAAAAVADQGDVSNPVGGLVRHGHGPYGNLRPGST